MLSDHPTHARGQRSLRCRLFLFRFVRRPGRRVEQWGGCDRQPGSTAALPIRIVQRLRVSSRGGGKPRSGERLLAGSAKYGSNRLTARSSDRRLPALRRALFHVFNLEPSARRLVVIPKRGRPIRRWPAALGQLSAAGQRPRPALDWAATRRKSGQPYLCVSRVRASTHCRLADRRQRSYDEATTRSRGLRKLK